MKIKIKRLVEQHTKLKKLILGYDVMFPYCEVPNALNPKYLEFAPECDWNFDKSEEYFNKTYKKPWPVFNARLLVELDDESGYPGYFAIDKKSVYDIIKDRERGKGYEWYYLIEPFGHVDNFLGITPEYKEEFFHKFIPSHTIEEIKNHNGYLIINYAIDGGFGFRNLEQLHISLKELNIPFDKIIIIHNDIHLEHNMRWIFKDEIPKLINYCWSLNSKSKEYYNKIKTGDFNFWNQEDRKRDYDFMTKLEALNFNKKTYKFLNLNRRLRKHRLDLIHFLYEENILDDVLISYDSKLVTGDGYHHAIDKWGIDKWNNFYNFLEQTSPKIVDYDDLENVWGYGFESKEAYQKSLISILSETFFYEECGYLSEKIWKPIAHGHPFILVGPHNSLKFLREEFGFKTFHPIIDESYDEEENPQKRMQLIRDEIKRLNSYTLEELKNIISNLNDIIMYNKDLLSDYGSKKICLDHLHYLRISDKNQNVDEIHKNFILEYQQTYQNKKYNII